MATIVKSWIGAWYLQTYLYKTLLENFEPTLQFAKLWEKPMVDNGIWTVSWARASQLTVNIAWVTLTEWVTPNSTGFSYTTISATPVQYGLYVEISDRLLKASPTKIITDAAKELWNNLARVIDQVIQVEVMAWTNVLYSDVSVNAARVDLASTDIITGSIIKKAVVKLRSLNAPTIDGTYYLAVLHPFVEWDLRGDTSYIEFSKYTTPDKLFKGEVWALHGCRFVMSSNIQTFTSTTTVYPTLVLWAKAYWVAEWQGLQTFYKELWSGNDPINQRATIGAKVDFVAKRLQENAMVRIETAATNY